MSLIGSKAVATQHKMSAHPSTHQIAGGMSVDQIVRTAFSLLIAERGGR
jgi:hypothetical protein